MTDNHTPQTTPPHAVPTGGPKGMIGAHDTGESDEINLGPILQAVREGWKWPVALGGAFAFLAVVIVLFTKPVFNASGTLYLAQAEKTQSAGSGSVDGVSLLSGLLAQGSSMETQVEIINSRDMIERAVLASGINAQVWQIGHRPSALTFAGWKLGGQRLSLYAPGPQALRALYAHVTDPALQGETLTIRFGQAGQYQILHHGQALLTGKLGQPAVGPELRLMLRAVQPHYVPAANTQYHIQISNALGVYKALANSGAISVVRGTGVGDNAAKTSYLVTISANSTDPFVARRLTNALMQTYLNQTRSWSTDQAAATYDYLSRQLDKIRTALSNADARLASYQSKSGVIAVSAGAKEMISQLADYETQRSQVKITLYGLQQIQKTLAHPGGTLNPYLFSSKDLVMNSLATRLAEAQSKLIALQKRYTAAAPQVVQVQADIASIRSAISALVQNQEKMATQQLQSIDAIISQHQTDMGKYPHSELEVISLTRSSEVLGKLYMFLLEKQKEAAISKASTLTKNRILDTALVGNLPVAPNAKRDVLLYGLLGVLLGLSVVIVRYLLHPGYRSDEELRRRYPFLPVYGLLPAAHTVSRNKETVFQMPDPRSGYGEALRLLRGNFYLAVGEARGQVVAMTSAVPGDGKSTLAFQLAAALAQDGKKVLLIDADLRNPHAHLAFHVTQEPGLAGVLAGRSTWQAALHHIAGIGIDLITAGNTPPNPSEHLGSGRLEQILAELRADYDTIFVDTPPFPMVGDILTIGPLADRLLTIVKVNHTPRRAYQEHLQGILGLNRPVGLVINGIRVQGSYGYGYGYGEAHTPPKGWRRYLAFRNKKR
ncbi:GumC family protein [Acidithiobacillus ferrooxidans]|uniref:GumC family protein n=1 Tax=Acidithiobacillus ferrooxidans TaxID=920 RepID=UPI0027DF45B6|nr:polysaccharide biosynthesis tyrosine autokinase [Acidithiobacillus ferrooxidans]